MTTRKVPVLSLKKYTEGTPEQRESFCHELFDAFKEYGFVVIENHSIDASLLNKAYSLSKQFFDLPTEKKLSYYIKDAGGQRGYTPFGVEHAKDAQVKDLKEFYHVGPELSKKSPYIKKYLPNKWPAEVPEFKETFSNIFAELEATGLSILEALAPSLGVEKDFFASRVVEGKSVLRLLHYPPIPEGEDPRCIRAAAHGDINLITLLVSATASGLELLDKDGKWIPVESNPNTIVVNIGDMLSRITNDVLPSTIHRVVNPEDSKTSRYSMPLFVHPRPEVILSCLEKFKGDGAKYPDISSDEFLMQRLKEIGLKKA